MNGDNTLGTTTSRLPGSAKKRDLGMHSRKKRKKVVDPPGSSDEKFLITPDEGQAAQSQEGHRKKAKKRKLSRETSPSNVDIFWVTTNCEAEISSSPPKKKKEKKRKKKKLDIQSSEDEIWSQPFPEKAKQPCPNNNQGNGGCVYDYTPSRKKKKKKKKKIKREEDFGDPNKFTEEKAESPSSIKKDYTSDSIDTQLDLFASSPHSTTDTKRKEMTRKKVKSQKLSQSLRADDSDVTEIDLETENTMASTKELKRKARNSVLKSAASKSHARLSQSAVSAAVDTTCPSDSEHPPSETDEEVLDSVAFSTDAMEATIKELEEYIPHVRSLTESAIRQLAERDLARFRRFKKKGIAVKFGVYSKAENALLKRNVEAFLEISGIKTAEKVLFPHRFPEEQAEIRRLKIQHLFCEHIGKDIARPWRLIYYRARKLLDPQNYNGCYSEKEKKKLRKYYAIYGNNWKKISDLMNRSSHSISLKISQMIEAADCNSGPWAEDEIWRLTQTLKDILRSKGKRLDSTLGKADSSQALVLPREHLYKNIGWMRVASKVQTRCWRQCKKKWISILTKKMMSPESLRSGMNNLQFKIALIERLYTLNVEDTSEINWESISEVIGNVPPVYVQDRFYRLKMMYVPFWNQKQFPEVIDYLFDVTLPELKAAFEQMAERHRKKKPIKLKKIFQFTDIFNDDSGDDDELIHMGRDSS